MRAPVGKRRRQAEQPRDHHALEFVRSRVDARAERIAQVALDASVAPETVNNFTAERSVFANPYVAPEIAGRTDAAGLFYPGRGRFALDQDGNRVELSRAERRTIRERAELIREQAELNELVAEFNARPQPTAPPLAPANPDAD